MVCKAKVTVWSKPTSTHQMPTFGAGSHFHPADLGACALDIRGYSVVRSRPRQRQPARLTTLYEIVRSLRRAKMPSINKPGSGHAGPSGVTGWQWLPYTNAG